MKGTSFLDEEPSDWSAAKVVRGPCTKVYAGLVAQGWMLFPTIDSRSDCHGWGAHPLWHLHTGVAGVRSAAPWYEKILVAPQPAHLKFIRSSTPTPKGRIGLDLRFDGGNVTGTVTLPDGLTGEFAWRGNRVALRSGRNEIARQAE